MAKILSQRSPKPPVEDEEPEWQRLPPAEWRQRLHRARTIALQMIAQGGLDFDGVTEFDVSSLVVYGNDAIGPALNPSLGEKRRKLDDLVELASARGHDLHGMSDTVTNYTVAVAEAAYLLGVIGAVICRGR